MTTTSLGPTATPVETARRGTTAILAIILVGYFMVILDSSIVIIGLPHIQDELGMTSTALAWVQDAYLLTFGGLLLLGARAGDVLGRRRMFAVGLAVFTLASVAVGLAPTGGLLVAARAVQGVGAAVLAPSTLALLTVSFPEGTERTRATAAYGAVAGIGASVGLVVGAMMGFFLFTSQYLQDERGFSALAAGFACFPMTAVNFVVALAVPRLQRRTIGPVLLVAGLVLAVAGMAWLGSVDASASYAAGIALPMMLIGAGQGLAFGPLTASGIAGVEPSRAGAASGVVNSVHQLGGALGMSLVLAVTSTYAAAMTAGAVLLLAALAAAVLLVLPSARRRSGA